MALPSLLIFGPQTTWPLPSYFSQLRSNLLSEPRLARFTETLRTLPRFWQTLVEADPRLQNVPGSEILTFFENWIEDGEFSTGHQTPLAIISTPLTVVIHIVQYLHFLKDQKSTSGLTHSDIISHVQDGGVQGFCTGLLAAIAVATSHSEEDVVTFGAVALRLAVCTGAYVDLDGAYASPPSHYASLAVRWRPEASRDKVLDILMRYTEAYVSVISDPTSVTITTPEPDFSSLSHQLTASGLIVKPVELSGRFHSTIHRKSVERIMQLSISNPDLRFPAFKDLLAPVRANNDANLNPEISLHQVALEGILTELANWHLTVSGAVSQTIQSKTPTIMQFGLVDSVPSILVREHGLKVTRYGTKSLSSGFLSSPPMPSSGIATPAVVPKDGSYTGNAIAVVGMACKFPGADSIDEFWDIISQGISMCETMPEQRFSTTGLRRTADGDLKFWGNFIRDIDAFDNKFFKKSSREAASTDPQQRLLLQVAYEALESAGYFGEFNRAANDDIGVYLGACSNDYNDNVASHPPNAFSSLGTLRAFLAGRISHYFGWTGPSITYDTACSSSAVAIHAACKALETRECSRAVAGGVSLYTNPNFYQNLAAASFLSPTGPCKPFDIKADGYSRGEGIGLVVLKRLSDAVADGDSILGVIGGSAVNQNENSTSITVPHSPSQAKLYRKVVSMAGIDPKQVSLVEAHGTGTQAGDPVEFESIRHVFGGPNRPSPLYVSSVKGNIGHLEGASGVAALIKVLLLMQHKTVAKQANFSVLNPKIAPPEADAIEIPTSTKAWDNRFQVAIINNYGAAGSNAAMIVCQPPTSLPRITQGNELELLTKYPLFISANSPESLAKYCQVLQSKISQWSTTHPDLLSSLAFNLATKQNLSLTYVLATTVTSIAELSNRLSTGAQNAVQLEKKPRPVVLAFGGQVGSAVGLSQSAYNKSALLRFHLDRCDHILRSAGLKGLFPDIFQTAPVEDVVNLHAMLFSLQYACAMSWLDSGLKVDTVIGHSFGQLTALCVSGSLSLEDAMKLVCGRARLMQTNWGAEKGSMISIEADIAFVSNLISSVQRPSSPSSSRHRMSFSYAPEIACYNGATSHVVVGTEASINALVEKLANYVGQIKYKKLNVTHGFHSELTQPILGDLTKLSGQLSFNEPTISLETCSKGESWTKIEPRLIAEHTRTPVFFGEAVERIAQRLGSCTWLEAGSNSSITGMVRRALGTAESSSHSFHSVNLGASGGMEALAETTTHLWEAGHKVQFWPYHRSQKYDYSSLNLPPYQFDKPRHWLTWEDTTQAQQPVKIIEAPVEEKEPVLLSFVGFNGKGKEEAVFQVDTRSEAYKTFVNGHAVLNEPLCPAPLYVELVSQAAMTLYPDSHSDSEAPFVEDLEIKAPLGLSGQAITMALTSSREPMPCWTFTLSRRSGASSAVVHATGKVGFRGKTAPLLSDFARYENLIGHHRSTALMTDPKAEALQGSQVYKTFGKVVTYHSFYKGVRSVFAKGNEVAGLIELPEFDVKALDEPVFNPIAVDNFIQVSGLHVNCLNEIADNEVYVCTKVDKIQQRPDSKRTELAAGKSWMVYANFYPIGDKEVLNDIFVFEPSSRRLEFVILGARFTRVLITSLAKVLSKANGATVKPSTTTISAVSVFVPATNENIKSVTLISTHAPVKEKKTKPAPVAKPSVNVYSELKKLLNMVTDIPVASINDDSTFEDLGIDSLMITEVVNEIRSKFETEMDATDIMNFPNIGALGDHLGLNVLDDDSSSTTHSDSTSISEASSVTGVSTPDESEENTAVEELSASYEKTTLQLAKMLVEHLETTAKISANTNLSDLGLDSLLSIELANDIKGTFGVAVNMADLDTESTFADLCGMVTSQQKPTKVAPIQLKPVPSISIATVSPTAKEFSSSAAKPAVLSGAQQAFEDVRYDYATYAQKTGFAGFWKNTYPMQSKLVLAYVVEAFEKLGCPLSTLPVGHKVEITRVLPKHSMLKDQLYRILRDKSLVHWNGSYYIRSELEVDRTPSTTIFAQILESFPQHASEHKLLHVTGSNLAECLEGTADPLKLLFLNKANKAVLEDVYANGPMYEAITKLLGSFLSKAFTTSTNGGTIDILELGGGTGGTTKYIIDFLIKLGIPFTYTFTDISGSLVAAAKRTFAGRNMMQFMTMDIEKQPDQKFLSKYHCIISTNCIHATKDLPNSTGNINKMLRPDGFVCLVEFTRNMFWFDLVFGLLDGWWFFEDGRKHVLASESFWDKSMRSAGFKHVTWTDGASEEARTLRIITGFAAAPQSPAFVPEKRPQKLECETVAWKVVGSSALLADIYLPSEGAPAAKRPVALMIHGGGHVMFTRKETHPLQVKMLLEKGFLPVSVEYRFCPEINIIDGAMTDVRDALQWCRATLPGMKLDRSDLYIDGGRVGVVGWSTGGQLAMTLGYTAAEHGIKPPEAILAFYPPIVYESDWWTKPIYPKISASSPHDSYDLLEGVRSKPLADYYPPSNKNYPGQMMTASDPRWRFVLHMNWRAQHLPLLLNGLPTKSQALATGLDPESLKTQPQPPMEKIVKISPHAQIVKGNYRTPTFLVHGTADELIPWQHSRQVVDALEARGVKSGLYLLEGAEHLFDTFPPSLGYGSEAIQAGYDFFCQNV